MMNEAAQLKKLMEAIGPSREFATWSWVQVTTGGFGAPGPVLSFDGEQYGVRLDGAVHYFDPEELKQVPTPGEELAEAIEGELITRDKGSAAGIARDIIKGAGASLYKDGQRPNPEAIAQRAEKMANNFHNQLLMAIDQELGK